MLFKPFGVKSGDVVDPEVLGGEFQEASRVINETSWWQWADAAFTDTQVLADSTSTAEDGVVRVSKTGITAPMGTHVAANPVVVPAPLATPARIPNEDLFQIPYNHGLAEIDDTSVSWTSKYSELLFVAFSFQYIREQLYQLFGSEDTNRIRTQIRLRIDGGDLPGCGPYIVPFDGKSRGTGIAVRSAAPVLVGVAVVPAGTHRVWAVAGQRPSELAAREDSVKPDEPFFGLSEFNKGGDAAHEYGVGIGSRRMMVIRFPRGGTLYP